jgi:hypothetical protein
LREDHEQEQEQDEEQARIVARVDVAHAAVGIGDTVALQVARERQRVSGNDRRPPVDDVRMADDLDLG